MVQRIAWLASPDHRACSLRRRFLLDAGGGGALDDRVNRFRHCRNRLGCLPVGELERGASSRNVCNTLLGTWMSASAEQSCCTIGAFVPRLKGCDVISSCCLGRQWFMLTWGCCPRKHLRVQRHLDGAANRKFSGRANGQSAISPCLVGA